MNILERLELTGPSPAKSCRHCPLQSTGDGGTQHYKSMIQEVVKHYISKDALNMLIIIRYVPADLGRDGMD